jgi:hypothetical protein
MNPKSATEQLKCHSNYLWGECGFAETNLTPTTFQINISSAVTACGFVSVKQSHDHICHKMERRKKRIRN